MSVDTSTLAAVGRRAGLCAVGFCRAEPFSDSAQVLHERKQAGLHGGMQFTYRNPDRSTDPARLVPGAAALVVGALEFRAESPDRPDDGSPYARVAAYAQADYYTPLRAALEAVAEALRAEGHRAVVSADDNGLVDRAAAHRAGIGWWGKNSNILLPSSGSLVVLGAVVTDAPLVPADPEPVADGCGSCRRCLDGCPTGAIVAPGTVDARRCLAWLVQADGVFDPRLPRRAGRPHLRVRRLLRSVPTEPGERPPAGPRAGPAGSPGVGAGARSAGFGGLRAAVDLRALVHTPAPAPLPAPQCPGCAGQRGRAL